ncbi:MAG: hypothetical protein V2I97_21770 [Desulfococcaceae bacterium]|nr:hypothetical protein [Desulfococcaceae bacterium]
MKVPRRDARRASLCGVRLCGVRLCGVRLCGVRLLQRRTPCVSTVYFHASL